MSLAARALKGIIWSAASSIVQLFLSLTTFIVVTRHLGAAQVGAFGAAVLLAGLVETLLGAPLTQSLEQRATLAKRHIDATFWIGVSLSLIFALGLVLTATPLTRLIHAPAAAPLLCVLALGLPMTVAAGVPGALLSRDLRYGELGRIGAAASAIGSLVGIGAVSTGWGVWSLVAADMAGRAVRLVGVVVAIGFRPGRPKNLGSMRELMAFNIMTLVTFGLGYLDLAAPRLLTSVFLGATNLGYYAVAQRILDLLSQVALGPINRVMMTAVARLQDDQKALRALIRTIYMIATTMAYPAFLAAVILAPDLVTLLGPQWSPAVLTIQILLLVGLRTSTGTFNFAILRGTGRTTGPVFILSAGLAIQLVLVPIGAHFGTAGVAAAVFLRTLATWPIGCVLVERATGLAVREQLTLGVPALLAALIMCAVVMATLHFGVLHDAPSFRVACAAAVGLPIYGAALLALSARERRVAMVAVTALRRGDRAAALAQIKTLAVREA